MPRLEWDKAGERFFETGLDRGTFQPTNSSGSDPWSGLISVEEAPSGGAPRPYYIDGVKYLNLASVEEYEASITAFTAPPSFIWAEGVSSVQRGLYVTQQKRQAFHFSYRTRVGNDALGVDYGYKIHIVYNALASPTGRSHSTIGDSAEPVELSWNVTTLPPKATGFRPTSHFIIESAKTPAALLTSIEDILYGSPTTFARIPNVTELVALFNG
jgi:hypothetical protein